MSKVVKLIQSVNEFVSKADGTKELSQLLLDHPNRDKVLKAVNNYESMLSKLLRGQKREFITALKLYTSGQSNDDTLLGAVAELVMEDIKDNDDFDVKMKTSSIKFLTSTVPEFSSAIMQAIDKDIAFNTLSPRTLQWIEDWSEDLGKMMKLSTHKNVQSALRTGIQEGLSIQDIELMLSEHPQFNRNRARKTAITEVLTANTVSQHEAYEQSPAVTGKTWLHSGPKSINPRPAHVELSGTTVDLEEEFDVNGYSAKHPRDTNLPPSERVYCHCALSPYVDKDILGLSKEEKEIIRQQAMREMGV